MVKSFICTISVLIILVGGAVYEHNYITKNFSEFNINLTVLYQKVEEESATANDVLSVQNSWLEKKRHLHVFIPHTEIKEIDMWLSETVSYVREKEWLEAISKLEVLIELSEQIPLTFNLRLENIL